MPVIQKLWDHVRTGGPSELTYVITKNLLLSLSHHLEARYDHVHHIQTQYDVALEELDDVSSRNKAYAEDYVPTPVSVLRRSLTVVTESLSDFVFIDIGSGKGRMLFAAADYPFKKIIGVEFSRRLSKLAEGNINSFRSRKQACFDIESVVADATEYRFPDEPLFIFMFNPFSAKPMAKMLDNLRRHHEKTGKPIYIAYYNPRHGNLLQQSGFLEDAPYQTPVVYFSLRPVWPLATFRTRKDS